MSAISQKTKPRIFDGFPPKGGLRPGDEVHIKEADGSIRVVKVRPIEEYEGIAKGVTIDFQREKEDRF